MNNFHIMFYLSLGLLFSSTLIIIIAMLVNLPVELSYLIGAIWISGLVMLGISVSKIRKMESINEND